MADGTIQLNPGTGGKQLDTTEITRSDGTVVQRERDTVAGEGAGEIARVQSAQPDGTEYGLVTRNIPSRSSSIDEEILLELRRIRFLLELMADEHVKEEEDV